MEITNINFIGKIMFNLTGYEMRFLEQLDSMIEQEKDNNEKYKLLTKKIEFIALLHKQELEWIKGELEFIKQSDKYDLEKRALIRK